MDDKNKNEIVIDYMEGLSYRVKNHQASLDEIMAVVVKPKPKWMPAWVWKKILNFVLYQKI